MGYAASRASGFAFAASHTHFRIDMSHKILHFNSSVLAGTFAFATAYAADGAFFHGKRAFVMVHTGYPYYGFALDHRHQFKQPTWTCLHTLAASDTLFMVNHGNAAFWIDVKRVEDAGSHTVTTAKTAIVAVRLSLIKRAFHSA